MKTVAIVGTFDTKGTEFAYLKELLEEMGVNTFTIHCGTFEPIFVPNVSNSEVAEAAGKSLAELNEANDRALATATLAKGAEILIPKLYAEGKFDAIISLGGSGGTSLATPAMRALPIGVPKVMVSTMASGNVSQYVGTSDITMMPSIVDVSGLNVISKKIFANAAAAVVGMVKFESKKSEADKKTIGATMFGVTTPCVSHAQKYLEDRGYEVLVFHATGAGGKSMEALVEAGFIQGVLDLTTTEWCDELVGGVLNAGPHRLEAAAKKGVPQVVSVGALDMVNFGPYETVPKQFAGRNFYKHNPTVTLMRTTVEENRQLGEIISSKLNMAEGKTALLLPLKGVSMIDAPGQPFYGADEDAALFDALRNDIDTSKVELIEKDLHINDVEFAEFAAQKLIDLMEADK